ncbi:F-box protein At5g07610-like [Salvia splendens]|uniref:F-box protein At5g07610-like n=1 Tax=Salvia splendens TaxID=180675 RepID=UPI001C277ADA|nr:F-box protein At5g07610-like [Salvia splendens]
MHLSLKSLALTLTFAGTVDLSGNLRRIFSSSHKLVPYSVTVPNSKILNLCNGLLLLQSVHPDPVEYHVYNSTTKQSRTISLTDSEDFKKIIGLTLAFDTSKSPHYKIMCVRAKMKPPSARERHCRTSNCQSFTWRVCLEQLTAPTGANFSNGVHCNNVIHGDNYPHTHIYYNINKNVVGNLPHAQVPWHGGRGGVACHCQLQESNGLLYHIIIVSHLGDKSIEVYELQEDYSQWLLKYHDDVGQLPGMVELHYAHSCPWKDYLVQFSRQEIRGDR